MQGQQPTYHAVLVDDGGAGGPSLPGAAGDEEAGGVDVRQEAAHRVGAGLQRDGLGWI